MVLSWYIVHQVDCRASWLLKPPHIIGGVSAEDRNREFDHCVSLCCARHRLNGYKFNIFIAWPSCHESDRRWIHMLLALTCLTIATRRYTTVIQKNRFRLTPFLLYHLDIHSVLVYSKTY